MDYEQKYKKALERARYMMSYKEVRHEDMEYLFPELGESEDERIRKAILEHIQLCSESIPNRDKWIAWLENQREQKHVDKIEPKFHEGDWVVTDKGDTVQIGTVNNDYYTIGNGMLFSMPYVDTSWHLWTIKDAKAGDVLVSANNQPFIYNGKYTDSTIGAHIGISYDGKEVFIAEGYNWTANKDVKPATKEQCDFLFQRIKEGGYEWNADEKVVNKVIIYE